VEAAGIEPASEDCGHIRGSTGLARVLDFPSGRPRASSPKVARVQVSATQSRATG